MCQNYFGLSAAPFSIAPDPRYLYLSPGHQEALATLLFGMNSDGGFVLLTGEVGAGKTTLCRYLLEQIPEACDVAYIFNPKLTVLELLSTICDEFRIAYSPGNTSIKLFVDLINAYLLDAHANGRRAVLIIDEAQNLSAGVLEQMRLLTNLETSERKLLQIILLGQPELATMLERPELRQLAQRIVARYHLGPLSRSEVGSYVRHRLEISGASRRLFPNSLMGTVYRLSKGVPRVINTLCDRALLGTYVQSKERVDRATLTQAAREVLSREAAPRDKTVLVVAVGTLLLGLALTAAGVYQRNLRQAPAAALTVPADRPALSTFALVPARAVNGEAASTRLTTLAWPAEVPRAGSEALAFSTLFQTWGIDYPGGTAPCEHAARVGLSCRTGRGGLDELRHLNRPVILHMLDERGRRFYAALTRTDGHAATFAVGDKAVTVALGALASHWSGDYTALLRLPPDKQNALAGANRASGEWLSRQLALARGGKLETPARRVSGDELRLEVKRFQLAQGLVPDGIAGPETLARLSAVADQAAPRLFSGSEEN